MFPVLLRLGLVQLLHHGRRQLPLGRSDRGRREDRLEVGADEQGEDDVKEDQEKHFFDDRVDGEQTERDHEGVITPADDSCDEGDRQPLDQEGQEKERPPEPVKLVLASIVG